MKNSLYILIGLIVISCQKNNLDPIAFPSEKVTEYKLEGYEGEIDIPEQYAIADSLIHLFSIPSTDSKTGDVFSIYAIYIGDMSTIIEDTVILYAHGQGKNMDNYWTRAKLLANIGHKNKYGVLMMDYRGFGMSEGESSEHGLVDDLQASIDWLKSKGVNGDKTIYYGYSLGCIPLINHAAYNESFKAHKLIIESPLASVQYLTNSSTLINVNSKFITNHEFDNAETMKNVDIPLMWLHGIEDTYISIDNGEVIYENHNGPYKEAHRIAGSDHSEIPTVMGYEDYLEKVEAFIQK